MNCVNIMRPYPSDTSPNPLLSALSAVLEHSEDPAAVGNPTIPPALARLSRSQIIPLIIVTLDAYLECCELYLVKHVHC